MSAILGTSVTGAGAAGAYAVNNSLRFRRSSPSYLSRTFSAGNLRLWTWSAWVKRGVLASDTSTIFDTNSSVGGEPRGGIKFRDDCLYFNQNPSGSSQTTELKSTAVFRDPSAWYHVVVAWDTAQATAANRVKMYINGVQITSFQIATYPGQNTDSALNSARTHKLGADGPNITGECFDGYLAEVNFIGGLALTPSSFGETNASTGVWQPKAYTGSYSGTNSFYQKYSSIATTSGSNTGLGQDFSGNGNYFNTNNISVTPGSTYDAMTDSPTPASSTVGNYAVMNPTANFTGTLSNGNLTLVTTTPGNDKFCQASIKLPRTGKWYWENTISISTSSDARNRQYVGNVEPNSTSFGSIYAYFNCHSSVLISTATVNSNLNAAVNTGGGGTVAFAYDADAGSLWMYKDGNINTATTANITNLSNANGDLAYMITEGSGTISGTNNLNFGQRPFAYSVPSGFNRLQTYNLPTPTIGASSTTLANEYFDATLYTGNGSSQSITNSGSMQPDFVWIKSRSNASYHHLVDVVRGTNSTLYSNSTEAQSGDTNVITAFNSNGFSVGSNAGVNGNARTYVGWQWDAGSSNATNTSGSITSTVRANTTSGFSVVTYTGTGSVATVGHGLGATPSMIIVKCRQQDSDWPVYHVSQGATKFCNLNSNSAFSTNSAPWNNTSPTSTVFTVGTSFGTNWPSNNMVAYCFAEKAGYSKFGGYTGNGSTDGTFVYTGFRPKYLMVKCSSNGSTNWVIVDTSRSPYNVTNLSLEANAPDVEQTGTSSTMPTMDLLSNGFKIRTTSIGGNGNGYTYIYMAFAEFPFNYSLAR